jgi:hypothetical protein
MFYTLRPQRVAGMGKQDGGLAQGEGFAQYIWLCAGGYSVHVAYFINWENMLPSFSI